MKLFTLIIIITLSSFAAKKTYLTYRHCELAAANLSAHERVTLYTQEYERLKAETLEKLSPEGISDIRFDVKRVLEPGSITNTFGFFFQYKKGNGWLTERAITFEVSAYSTHLTFSNNIRDSALMFRNKGLTRLFYAAALQRYPRPAVVSHLIDVNSGAVLLATYLNERITADSPSFKRWEVDEKYKVEVKKQLQEEIQRSLKKQKSAAALRQRLITAFFESSPEGRVLQSLGFQNLDDLTVSFNTKVADFNDLDVSSTVIAGPFSENSQIFLKDIYRNGDHFELLADGTLKTIIK